MSEYIKLEPIDNEDHIFLSQVRNLVEGDSMVSLGPDKTLLIDKYLVPIFDMAEAKYGMVSEVQVENAYEFLRYAPAMIKRLLNIIDNKN